jgi:hypothetical protein
MSLNNFLNWELQTLKRGFVKITWSDLNRHHLTSSFYAADMFEAPARFLTFILVLNLAWGGNGGKGSKGGSETFSYLSRKLMVMRWKTASHRQFRGTSDGMHYLFQCILCWELQLKILGRPPIWCLSEPSVAFTPFHANKALLIR